MDTNLQRPSLADRLNDPNTAEVLHRLLDHAQSLEQALSLAQQLPNLLAIAVDFFDALSLKASQDGIDIEQRATNLLKLLVQITEPGNMQAIKQLCSRLPALAQGSALLDEFPKFVATAVDVFDEWASQMKAEGIDLDQSLRQGLHAALYLGNQIRREEIDRIGFLLKSEVMSESFLATMSTVGSALSMCGQGNCEYPLPKRVGLLGLLGAIRDPNTQRALSFALQFAKCFGGELEKTPQNNLCPTSSSSNQG